MVTEYSPKKLCEGARGLKRILDGWMKEDIPRCVTEENIPGEVADFLDCLSSAYLTESSLDALLAVYKGNETREKVRYYSNRGKYSVDAGLLGLARQGLIESGRRRSSIHITKPFVLSKKGRYLANLFNKNLADILYKQAEELILKELPDKIIEAERRLMMRENCVYSHLQELVCLLSQDGKSIKEIKKQLKSDLGLNLRTKPLKKALDYLIENNSCIYEPGDDGVERYKLPDVAVRLED